MTKSTNNKSSFDINDNTSGNIVIQFFICINTYTVYHMTENVFF